MSRTTCYLLNINDTFAYQLENSNTYHLHYIVFISTKSLEAHYLLSFFNFCIYIRYELKHKRTAVQIDAIIMTN